MLRFCSGLALVAAAWGQGGDDRFRFEAASIRPSAKQGMITKMAGGPGTNDSGRFSATNAELSVLVIRAYGLEYGQLRRPAWMDNTQFDVVANVPPGTTTDQFRRMLQNLLAERFRMQVHYETRVAAVYEMTVAKNGPKLKVAAEGAGTDDFVPGSGPRQVDRDNFPVLPAGRTNAACGHISEGSYCTFRMVTMAMLAQRLSAPPFVDRRVVDKTGLAGQYDFTLYCRSMGGLPPGPDDNAPGIELALQEQLGLKLALSKASVDVLVIDNSEKTPTEN